MAPTPRQDEKDRSPSSQDDGLATSRVDMEPVTDKNESQGGLKSYLVR